jgi:DNA-binding NarL/FixJ family response regulator
VAEAIENTPDLEMAGQARSLDPGVDEIEAIEPDVAIIDISLPDGHGLDLIQALRARAPDVATVVFSMYDEAVYAERAIRNGALSYVMKTQPVSRLLDAIRSARRGQVDLSQQMTGRILKTIGGGRRPDFPLDELSDRELEVFQMIGQGLSLPAIQERLCLSRKTVETHRRGAKEKLGLDSVSELIQHAMRWVHGRGRGEQLTELGRPPGAVAG